MDHLGMCLLSLGTYQLIYRGIFISLVTKPLNLKSTYYSCSMQKIHIDGQKNYFGAPESLSSAL